MSPLVFFYPRNTRIECLFQSIKCFCCAMHVVRTASKSGNPQNLLFFVPQQICNLPFHPERIRLLHILKATCRVNQFFRIKLQWEKPFPCRHIIIHIIHTNDISYIGVLKQTPVSSCTLNLMECLLLQIVQFNVRIGRTYPQIIPILVECSNFIILPPVQEVRLCTFDIINHYPRPVDTSKKSFLSSTGEVRHLPLYMRFFRQTNGNTIFVPLLATHCCTGIQSVCSTDIEVLLIRYIKRKNILLFYRPVIRNRQILLFLRIKTSNSSLQQLKIKQSVGTLRNRRNSTWDKRQ